MERLQIVLFLLLVCMSSANMGVDSSCKEVERNALLKFKDNFFIDLSNGFDSWVGDDCCKWKGVVCDNVTNNVIKLNLTSTMGYLEAGEVSPALLELKYLTYLDLSGISFNGSSIPEFFGSMKQIQYLYLSSTSFGGKIPQSLGNLKKLIVLDLSYAFSWDGLQKTNSLEWAFKLENLQYLDLSGMDLSQTFDSLDILFKVPSLQVLNLVFCNLRNSNIFIKYLPISWSSLKHLDLSENQFNGPFPYFIQNLSSLTYLDLSWNGFNSSLPSWLGNQVNLTHVDLSWNSFYGSFPSFFQSLSSISFLSLWGNQFTSSIPFWLANNTNLEHLSLGSNHFDGVDGGFMNTISHLCSLKYLDVSSNQLEEEVSNSHLNLSRCNTYDLQFLHLKGNNFSGNLPIIELFSSLELLDLSMNNLETLPPSLGKLSSLVTLDLSNNYLKVGLPLVGNFSSLQNLYLSNNNLEDLPPSMEGLSSLLILDLSYNFMTNVLVPPTSNLSSLTYLYMSHNNITTGPISLGELPSLSSLDLSYNQLNVLKLTGNLSSLYNLELSYNNLENFPPTLRALPSLSNLQLSNNRLSVVNQVSLANLSSLKHLDLSLNPLFIDFSSEWLPPFQLETLNLQSCKMNTTFPKWLLNQKNMLELDLSNTGTFGPLPSNIGNSMPSLTSLRLADNHINGSIPRSLCDLPNLNILDLQKNGLSGIIPDCWMNSILINVMDLSSNKLSGPIPNSLSKVETLQLLSLNSNFLQGKLPLSLGNCVGLLVLDVGKNNLHGKIPTWSGTNFPSLDILILRGNRLEGIIPPQLCSIRTLQIVDLASNNLGGTIPQCFGHFEGMGSTASPAKPTNSSINIPSFLGAPTTNTDEWTAVEVIKGEEREYTSVLHLLVNMDLSCNKLVGVIPTEFTTSTLLLGLNLSHNYLNGTIPQEIGRMKNLESLDLSCNNFSGSIPQSISSLTFLSTMNLSFNNLQGQIPSSTQLRTFNDSSFMGNPGLCGDQLTKKCFVYGIPQPTTSKTPEDEEGNTHEKIWFYLVIVSGFATGFWGVIGTLVVQRRWRHAYFQLAEELADWIYIRIAVRIVRSKGRN